MADVTRRVNDLLPYIDATLKDADGAFDLTNYTVRFAMESSAGTVVEDQTSTGSRVTLLDSTAGRVRFKPSSSGFATAGNYLAEFEATNPSSENVSFPNIGHLEIVLTPEIST